MRTTLNLKEELVEEAARATNIREKTKLVHAGLEALIERAARERLRALGGALRSATAGRRRRSLPK